jgi:hypothetical protein
VEMDDHRTDAGFAVDAEPGTRMTLGDAAPTNV